MNTVDELIKEIDDTPFDEDMKAMFRRIVKVSDVSSMTDRQREQYDEDLKCYLDWMATIAAEREDGVAEGIEKGKAEGRKESDAFFLDFLRKEGYSEERICAIMAGRAGSSPA